MRQTRPLPDTHPEFTVHHWQGFTEYRVEHWRLARDGSGRIVRGTSVWSWVDACVLAATTLALLSRLESPTSTSTSTLLVVGIVLTRLVWIRCTQVLHESLLVFPTLGIQLETHLGHPLFPSIATTRHFFIPLSALEDVVVHEGFRRWEVRYYLAALYRTRRRTGGSSSSSSCTSKGAGGPVEVRVAFENVLPYFPVLNVVYLGVQQTLFPPRIVETDVGVV